ncbi:helix-turn-helix transcriptional regulator [Ramlibacter sp. AW1]|uniref:Helix-turn-helix transcriptional regulator n=1 Tax=Ramlibacter aurantiacus TaxID=2801330 RepID=A0A937D5S8_9BURK|nr:helix-turn-helix transcriptional regulator [Ramlibacter aurantiacus]MBL0419061.1 helix-turn-helix transcriptional regulator [Ramlibacter aurantiacus]
MDGLDGMSAPAFSELVGAIYACVLEPQRWIDTCRQIAASCDSPAGGLCVHDRQEDDVQLFVFGYEAAVLQALCEQYAHSPMAIANQSSGVGEVHALSMPRFRLREGAFFREVLQPLGLGDILWFPALRNDRRTASLRASRPDSEPTFQQREIELFRLLAPHVCRALAVSDLLDICALRSQALEATLGGLNVGVFLLAGDGRVVYMNAAAQAQVRTGDALRLVGQHITPVHATARAEWSHAVDVASRTGGACPHPVAIPDGKGGGYVATLMPLAGAQHPGPRAPAAALAVFTQDPDQSSPMPGAAFARLHGLTVGELRVLLALSQGLGGLQAAEMLGITEPTLRTHLQRIYSKTGTSGQSDLLRLLDHSRPPLLNEMTRPGARDGPPLT